MSELPVVGFIGNAEGSAEPIYDFDKFLTLVGENTGNLMFQHACWRQIRNPKVPFRLGVDFDIDEFRRKIDVLFIPAANQLNPDWDLDSWAELIEIVDRPVVVAGLGAQAKVGHVADIELKAGTQRFLRTLADRAHSIGVRGEATLKLLQRYEVKNGVITGCPSNFVAQDISSDSINRQIRLLPDLSKPKIDYVFGTMEDYARDFEAELYRLWSGYEGNIIYQTHADVLRMLFDGFEAEQLNADLDWQNSRLRTGLSSQEYKQRIKSRGRFFYSAESWIQHTRQADITIGMRIHGAIAAIQGGGLGICVVFDSRTLELVETMGYPHLLGEDLSHLTSMQDVADAIRFSGRMFDERRTGLRTSLKSVMERHGILTSL